jgi:hypothetical protein
MLPRVEVAGEAPEVEVDTQPAIAADPLGFVTAARMEAEFATAEAITEEAIAEDITRAIAADITEAGTAMVTDTGVGAMGVGVSPSASDGHTMGTAGVTPTAITPRLILTRVQPTTLRTMWLR